MNSRWSSVSSEKKPEYPCCLLIAGRGLVAAALLVPALSVPVPADELAIFTQDAPRDYTILLKARQFVPPPGITEESLDRIRSSDLRRVHVIVQFFDPVTVRQQELLEELDVLLLKNQYVPNLAFYASLPPERALSVAALPFVRAVIHLEYWYKTEARLLAGVVTDYSRRPGGEILVGVEFHEDVSSDDAAAILREHSGEIVEALVAGRSLATIPESECVNLLNEDSIYWLLDLVEPHRVGSLIVALRRPRAFVCCAPLTRVPRRSLGRR